MVILNVQLFGVCKYNMNKLVIASLLLFTSCNALASPSNKTCDIMYEYTDDQFYTIVRANEAGKQDGLGKTLAAMVIVESRAGEDMVNYTTGDYGVGQIHLTTAIKRWRKRGYKGSSSALAERLLHDESFNHLNMLLELRFWKKVHGNNWKNIVKSYNAGYNYKYVDDSLYYDKIRDAYNKIDGCFS